MKYFRYYAFVLIGFFAMVLAGCGSSGSSSNGGGGGGDNNNTALVPTTVLTYVIGSDLQCGYNNGEENINEMKQVGSDSNLNIVVQTGGVGSNGCAQNDYVKYAPGYTDVNRTVIYQGSQKVIQQLGSTATVNMGKRQTLEEFVQWGVQNYPAQKYVLILWDHGGGINGGAIGPDSNTSSVISVPEAIKAISAAGVKFEVVAFDACLDGMAEIASGLAPYTNYVVASEDLVPGGGFAYDKFLTYIKNNPTANGLQIGKNMVDTYIAKHLTKYSDIGMTLAVIDTSKLSALVSAIDNLASALTSYVTSSVNNWISFAAIRMQTLDFQSYLLPTNESNSTDSVDLKLFAQNIAAANINSSVTTLANAVVTATNNAVVYSKATGGVAKATGLAVYFPQIMPMYNEGYEKNTTVDGKSFFAVNYSGAQGLTNKYDKFYRENNTSIDPVLSAPTKTGDATSWNISKGDITLSQFYIGSKDYYYSSQMGQVKNGSLTFDESDQNASWSFIGNTSVLLFSSANFSAASAQGGVDYLIPVVDVNDTQNITIYLAVEKQSDNKLKVVGELSSFTSKLMAMKVGSVYNTRALYRDPATGVLNIVATTGAITITKPNETFIEFSNMADVNSVLPVVYGIAGTAVAGSPSGI